MNKDSSVASVFPAGVGDGKDGGNCVVFARQTPKEKYIHMKEELTEEELAQIRKFTAWKNVAIEILFKWRWLAVFTLGCSGAALMAFLYWHDVMRPDRFTATTRLLFSPRQIERIQNMGDKQLLRVLERSSLKRRVGRTIPLPPGEDERLTTDLEMVQERKPTNLYSLTAHASSRVSAVRKVNAYADVLKAEYAAYRTQELDVLGDSLELRRKKIQDQIADLEGAGTLLRGEAGVVAPVEALLMLNGILSDQRRNYSLLSVDMANESVKKARCEEIIGDIGSTVIACAPLIRKKTAELTALDAEIAQLQEVYTDLNPKVQGKLEDRKILMDEYLAVLKTNGLDHLTFIDSERVEQAARELVDVQLRMDVLAEKQRALQQEIEENEAKAEELTRIIPSMERLNVRREDLERTMRDLEDQLGDIEYLRMSVDSDLHQIEPAKDAKAANPLSLKNILLAATGAIVGTMALMGWILLVELCFGKVRGIRELGAYQDMALLGTLPKTGALPEDDEKDVLGVVALNFCHVKVPKGNVVVCRLKGSEPQPRFAETLDWVLTMSGKKLFALFLVPSQTFEPAEGAEMLLNTMKQGNRGQFPVVNRYALAPTEIEMLQADLATLHQEFDSVFLFMPDGFRQGGNYFRQLLEVCDSVWVSVGANKTRRSSLAYVRRHVNEIQKPMMGMVTGASARVVMEEMEAQG